MLMLLWKGCRMTPRDGCREANEMLYPWKSTVADVLTVRATSSRHRYLLAQGQPVDRMLLRTPNCDGSLLCVCGHRQETLDGCLLLWMSSKKCWSDFFMLCIPLCIQIWYYVHRQVTPANSLEVY